MKKTKIIATIGPSSWPEEVMKKMIESGMNVARVNGAFADLVELKRVAELVRSFSKDVALMLDTKGHEVRLNKFESDMHVKPGQEVIIGNTAKDSLYPITYPDFYKDMKEGVELLIDDGTVRLTIESIKDGKLICKVKEGTVIKPAKSINVPGVMLSNPPLTERDIEQINFCIKDNWDFVAASFVRTIDDVKEIKKYTEKSHIKIIAKIEDAIGVKNFDSILKEVEGIMIARGDLGIEIPFEKLPEVQKEFIRKCNEAGKPVITATQMLESMIENPRATRAEISDVANAILDGSDAIMLSGETSSGKYPAEAVETMNKIALEIENNIEPRIIKGVPDAPEETNALTKACYEVCQNLDIKSVLIVSTTGRTARLLSRFRIRQPIYTFVSADYYARRMNLSKGVYSFVYPAKYKDRDDALNGIVNEAIKMRLVKEGEKVLIVGNASNAMESDTYFPNLFEIVDISEFLK